MVGQHAKWLEKCSEVDWRAKLASLNILLTSTVWRQVSQDLPVFVYAATNLRIGS